MVRLDFMKWHTKSVIHQQSIGATAVSKHSRIYFIGVRASSIFRSLIFAAVVVTALDLPFSSPNAR